MARKKAPPPPRDTAPPLVRNQEISLAPVDGLKPHPRNPRQGDVGAIYTQIDQHGFYGAIVAQRSTGYILAGNHRYQAALHAGMQQIPVAWLDVSDREALEILLSDNRTADLATYDDNELAAILKELWAEERDLRGTGYDADDLDQLIEDLDREERASDGGPATDKLEQLQRQWGTTEGQIWTIGLHRLMCGDSTNADHLDLLFAGARAQLVYTDPPYGVDYDGGTKVREKLEGDQRGTDIYAAFLPHAVARSEDTAAFYIWHAGGVSLPVLQAIDANRLQVRAQIIWNKNQAQYGALSAQYKQKHEPCFYCHKKGKAPGWHGPNTEVSVWDVDRERANDYHPTQKPIELAERAIRNSSSRDHIVADFFAGGGATILAAERLDRRCYAMELHPGYVAVILQRLADAGLEPRLAAGNSPTRSGSK